MIIKSLNLENIRSFRTMEEPISFKKGITLIEGDIAVGKSSILLSIEFALFGLGSYDAKHFLRNNERIGRVRLVFEENGVEYQVGRTLQKIRSDIHQKDCYLIDPTGKLSCTSNELKGKVLQILNFNESENVKKQQNIFRYSVFVPQEEMKKVIEEKREARLETLRKIFQIEEYQYALDNSRDLLKTLKQRKKNIEIKISPLVQLQLDLEENNKKFNELEGKLKENNKKFNELEGKLKEKTNSISELEKKIKRYSGVRDKQISILAQLSNLTEKRNIFVNQQKDNNGELKRIYEDIQNYTRKIELVELEGFEELPSLDSIIQIIKDQEDQICNVEKKLKLIEEGEKIINKCVETEEKIEDLEKDKKVMITRINEVLARFDKLDVILGKDYTRMMNDCKESNKQIGSRITKYREEITQVKKEISQFDFIADKEVCPICKSKIKSSQVLEEKFNKKKSLTILEDELEIEIKLESKNDELIKNYGEKIRTLDVLIPMYLEKLKDISDKEEKIAEKRLKVLDYLDDLKPYQDEIANKQETINEMTRLKLKKNNIEKAKNTLILNYQFADNIRKEEECLFNVITKLEEIERNMKEIDLDFIAKSAVSQSFKADLDKLEKLEGTKEQLEKEKQSIIDQKSKVSETLASIKPQLEILAPLIKQTSNDIQNLIDIKKKGEKLDDNIAWLQDYFIPSVANIENHVLGMFRRKLEKKMRELFAFLIDDYTLQLSIDKDFEPSIIRDGIEQEYKQLSGGERTSLALSYRMSLNQIVQEVFLKNYSNLLILDEPTDGFSKEQIIKLRDLFVYLKCPQVIIVSHNQEFEGFADHIYRVRKEKRNSSVSVISS